MIDHLLSFPDEATSQADLMTHEEALQAAVDARLISRPLVGTILEMCAEDGLKPSVVCGITGGEPLSERGKKLCAFLRERGA